MPPARGFTLTELLMAIMISAVLLAILGRFLTNFHQTREASKVMMEIQEQARFAMEYMLYGYIQGGNPGSARCGGIIWASSYDILSDGKAISFPDSTTGSTIRYEDTDDLQLYQIVGSGEPQPVIPYLKGNHEYRRGPYTVEVNFKKGPGPDPNRVVSIELVVKKDDLTFSLNSFATLRNY